MSALIIVLLLGLPQADPDTVVVCPAEFRQALGPWLEYRSEQGHSIVLVSAALSAEQIRQQIRAAAKGKRLRFVVLVGDAEPGMDDDPLLRARCVPVHRTRAQVNILWGSEPHIGTDNWYADLDDDQLPEVAIGRLTADTPQELSVMVAKILAYEQSRDFGPWRRQFNIVAGVGGFGPLADLVLESVARYFLTQGIPEGYRVSMTYGSWRSPYCPDPRQFHLTTLERLNEGAWLWVYIGHGYHLGLDRVQVPDGQYHILAAPDMPKLQCRHAAPIALFLACYAGAMDALDDCLAEEMLRAPGGPVAILAGSRVTMPYGMAVMSHELMDQCFRRRCPTLGEAILHAKRKMVKQPDAEDQERAMLDALAAAVSPSPKQLAAERAEHVLLLNLMGDPLLRLRYPKQVEVATAAGARAGQPLSVTGSSPVDGRATIELVVPRGALAFKAPARPDYPQTSEGLAQLQEVYDRANDGRLASAGLTIRGGRFDAQLDVPRQARGRCCVRVFVEGSDDFALGAAEVDIQN